MIAQSIACSNGLIFSLHDTVTYDIQGGASGTEREGEASANTRRAEQREGKIDVRLQASCSLVLEIAQFLHYTTAYLPCHDAFAYLLISSCVLMHGE